MTEIAFSNRKSYTSTETGVDGPLGARDPSAFPRGSRYLMFVGSDPKNHSLLDVWNQKPQVLGTWTIWVLGFLFVRVGNGSPVPVACEKSTGYFQFPMVPGTKSTDGCSCRPETQRRACTRRRSATAPRPCA